MSEFELYSWDKLSDEKQKELDLYIGTELLKEYPELLKQYNKEITIYKVNKYIDKFIEENAPKKKRVVRPKKKPEVNSEEVKQ